MTNISQVLQRSCFERETTVVAQNLLGCRLVSRIGKRMVAGVIVETEAYLPIGDPACHSNRGKTKSNRSMFEAAGHAYVYPIHASFCFNVATENAGDGCAVLVRAVQPIVGLDTMQERRGTSVERRITTGPSCLCQAFGFDRNIDGWDLTRGKRVWIEAGDSEFDFDIETQLMVTPRIGVTSAETLELRYLVVNNPYVSGLKRMRTR